MQTWGFAISFATFQSGNKSEYIHGWGATQPAAGLKPKASTQRYGTINATSVFWGATVYKMVRRMLSDHCHVCLSVLSVCNVRVLWPNGWMDQGETWHGGRPLSRPHCVRWGPSPPPKGRSPPNFRPMSIMAKRSPISATAEHLFYLLTA